MWDVSWAAKKSTGEQQELALAQEKPFKLVIEYIGEKRPPRVIEALPLAERNFWGPGQR